MLRRLILSLVRMMCIARSMLIFRLWRARRTWCRHPLSTYVICDCCANSRMLDSSTASASPDYDGFSDIDTRWWSGWSTNLSWWFVWRLWLRLIVTLVCSHARVQDKNIEMIYDKHTERDYYIKYREGSPRRLRFTLHTVFTNCSDISNIKEKWPSNQQTKLQAVASFCSREKTEEVNQLLADRWFAGLASDILSRDVCYSLVLFMQFIRHQKILWSGFWRV